MKFLRSLLALAALSSLIGCGGGSTGTTCSTTNTLTYANFGASFMASYCTGCHGLGGGARPYLGSQSAVQANATAIDSVAGSGPGGTNTAMPQGGSVSVADRQKLSQWLACGAP